MAEHSDPEGRNAFIRKLHRASLKTRAHEVFGDDGSWVIDQFDQARGSWQSDEGFDKFVRHVLRHCKKIVGKNAHRRRMAYIQACTDKQAFYSPDDEIGPPLTCLMKKTGLTSTEAAKEFNTLYSALTGGGKGYDPDAFDRAWQIVRSACSKNYPLAYLKVVVANEKGKRSSRQGRHG